MPTLYLRLRPTGILGIRNHTFSLSSKQNRTPRTHNPIPTHLWHATRHQPRSHFRLRCVGLLRERKTTQIRLQDRRMCIPRNLTPTLPRHPHSPQNIYKESDLQKERQFQRTLFPRPNQQPFPHESTKERVSLDWTNLSR